MGALFVSASSQRLLRSPPIVTAPPFTVAGWFKLNNVSASQQFWVSAASANITHLYKLGFNFGAPANVSFAASAGGAFNSASATSPTLSAGQWFFVIGREVTTVNRWVVLMQTGISFTPHINQVQATTARVPVGLDQEFVGTKGGNVPADFMDGVIAEFWMTNTDIGRDGLILNEQLVRQLARRGPFSVPHIAPNVIEYRSFRNAVSSDQDCAPDYFYSPLGRKEWSNVNGVIRGDDVPRTECAYVRPGDFIRPGIV